MFKWIGIPRQTATLMMLTALLGVVLLPNLVVPAHADTAAPTIDPAPTVALTDPATPPPLPEPPTLTPTDIAPDTSLPTDTLVPSETPTALPTLAAPSDTVLQNLPF